MNTQPARTFSGPAARVEAPREWLGSVATLPFLERSFQQLETMLEYRRRGHVGQDIDPGVAVFMLNADLLKLFPQLQRMF